MAATRLIALHINKGKTEHSVWQIVQIIPKMLRKQKMENISALMNVTPKQPMKNFS